MFPKAVTGNISTRKRMHIRRCRFIAQRFLLVRFGVSSGNQNLLMICFENDLFFHQRYTVLMCKFLDSRLPACAGGRGNDTVFSLVTHKLVPHFLFVYFCGKDIHHTPGVCNSRILSRKEGVLKPAFKRTPSCPETIIKIPARGPE